MRINFVYHSPYQLGSGYMGSSGLKAALERNRLLHYAYNQTGKDFLDIKMLRGEPIFFVRGFLNGRMPVVARAGDQFKAAWQSESYYTRHGEEDTSTAMAVENQKHFNLYFVTAETDLDKYDIPTVFLPSWCDTNVFKEVCEPEWKGLGFFGGTEGREDFLDQDSKGIIVHKKTILNRAEPIKQAQALAELICKFEWLVAPPGRCFNSMCGRAFEIMGCKRLCFQWLNEDTMFRHKTFFKDMEDIVYFKTYDELVDKYNYFLKHKSHADQIAVNGYEKVVKYHNENTRAKYIVECMRDEFFKWKKGQDAIPEWVSEVYRGD